MEGLMMGLSDIIQANQKKIVAIIPARGGSKRLKRKNMFPVWGKAMIHWSIKAAKESKYITDVWVTTEDEYVKAAALVNGAKVHDRDPKLADDKTFKQEAIRAATEHIAGKEKKPDIVVSLQANSPEITAEILDKAIEKFLRYDRNELISASENGIQNAAFRILKYDSVFQRDLSIKCGFFICDIHDIHTLKDVEYVEERTKRDPNT